MLASEPIGLSLLPAAQASSPRAQQRNLLAGTWQISLCALTVTGNDIKFRNNAQIVQPDPDHSRSGMQPVQRQRKQ